MRQAERRRARNRPIRTGVRNRVRKVEQDILGGDLDAAQVSIVQAISALDRAAQKGVIHRNNAARRKSRLMLRLNKASAQAQAASAETETAVAAAKTRKTAARKTATPARSATATAAKPRTSRTRKTEAK
jgi:small subunit ribosomal protein S20